ncbi:M20 metallopeptidase family protein [Vibrio sp. SCSIO 43137]|uniref:M20 metallopeptidase family protein n=1 Tax=Vibrio sp. SCSIO 43137 TaxID=3021011 RepID=UPI00230745EF|nr:amidohydrolase [Vibrio sp. SCSIO 43137]WCE28896.1 amidohydrolase [Vibrio sp. SCSIO 43137]
MRNFNIENELMNLRDYCISVRQDLHRIPELSGEEYKTSAYCKAELKKAGYEIVEYEGYTGFHVDLTVDNALDRIAFRADMDGLEMPDLTDDEFTSTHEGRAHNCGHDTHMAIAITTACYLADNKADLKYNVRFIFQMAEEDLRVPGASKMVEMGCMEGVDEVYALHNDASLDWGRIALNNNIMSSYGSAWTLEIEGKSSHGSTPHLGKDAVREGMRIVTEMDYLIAKTVNPFRPAVFGCGLFNGGTVANAIPDHVFARGTIRAMDSDTDIHLKKEFDKLVAESNMRGFNTRMEMGSYPAVINHKKAYQRVLYAAEHTVPMDYINENCQPMTGSEDFSEMINATRDRCGAMFFLGVGNSKKGINNYLHSNPYYIDNDAMLIGVQLFIELATS